MNISYIDYSPATKSLDIFFSGCNPPYCSGCYNSELIDFNCGTDWRNWVDKIEKYCHVAPMSEIKENEYNLNIPRYVDTFEEEEEIDIKAVQQDLKDIDKQIAEVDKELNVYLKELGLEEI